MWDVALLLAMVFCEYNVFSMYVWVCTWCVRACYIIVRVCFKVSLKGGQTGTNCQLGGGSGRPFPWLQARKGVVSCQHTNVTQSYHNVFKIRWSTSRLFIDCVSRIRLADWHTIIFQVSPMLLMIAWLCHQYDLSKQSYDFREDAGLPRTNGH